MKALPEGNTGKALALFILVLALAGIYFVLLSPLMAVYDSNAQSLEQRRETIRRYEKAVNDLPRLRLLAKQHRDRPKNGDLLLNGASDAIAAAALQSNLKEMVEGEGAKITSAAMLPPVTKEGYQRVGVRIAFSGNLQLLTTVLGGIATSHPILGVGNLDLHVAGDSEGGNEDPSLSIALDVFGYRAK
jgi:Tfp pilus assembly protein PilO